jgi:hypothetical protein
LPATFRADTSQRVEHAVAVVNVIQVGSHLGTEPALRDGMIGVGVETHGSIVFNFGDDSAGVRAIVGTDAVNAMCQASLRANLALPGKVPQSDHLVAAGRKQSRAIGSKNDALDDFVLMALESSDLFRFAHVLIGNGPGRPHGGSFAVG